MPGSDKHFPRNQSIDKDIRGVMGCGGAVAPVAKVYTEAEKTSRSLDAMMRRRVRSLPQIVIAEWIETARSLNRPIPEPKGKLAYA